MELAPAPMVRAMLSPVGPPVAIIGTVGNFSRMALTTSGVRAAADTLSMDTPASRRACMSAFSLSTVAIMGISITLAIFSITSLVMGAFTTTPEAPWASASLERRTVRSPPVRPPPTPHSTGMFEACIIEFEMTCCGVNG